MRLLVIIPVALIVIWLLIVLMLNLAGLTTARALPSLPESAPSFNLNAISFALQQPSKSVELPEPVSLPEKVAPALPEPEPELANEPEVIDTATLELQLPDQPVAQVQLALQIELPDIALQQITIRQLKVIKAVKKLIKKRVQKKSANKAEAVKKPRDKTADKKSRSKAVEVTAGAVNATKSLVANSTDRQVFGRDDSIEQRNNASAISRTEPKYPRRARRRGIEGVVTVSFLVAKSGGVQASSVRIISAKPAKVFDQAVLQAVLKWRFTPGTKPFITTQRVVFNLRK